MPRIVLANAATIHEAAQTLRAGSVVAFPTETVYGLGALTLNEQGLERVYELKGRPANNPLIAHVLDAEQARSVIAPDAWDDRCAQLAKAFWPGPLTLVLPKSPRVPARATAGLPTIAVRSPAHPVARALIEAVGVGGPISAPSANRSGRVSPTSAQHVLREFAEVKEARDLVILDGGSCDVGIESTVLDLTRRRPRVLRPGAVTLEQLRAILGEVDAPEISRQQASPGTSPRHYAPATPAEVATTTDLPAALQRHGAAGRRCAVLCFDASAVMEPNVALIMPRDASHYAHDLYFHLREADALGCDAIIIESPPHTDDLWRAVHDRLRRAAVKIE